MQLLISDIIGMLLYYRNTLRTGTIGSSAASWMVQACDMKIISVHHTCSGYMCSLHHFADLNI